jgi:hypothetical protein
VSTIFQWVGRVGLRWTYHVTAFVREQLQTGEGVNCKSGEKGTEAV